ncbi:hypothetical protein KSD_77110 [Ktedonobacter sp. SOSP1-85]|nr:hypothetical protein KSD_77110 [Ktedonobacter sp. SOSP1-85]
MDALTNRTSLEATRTGDKRFTPLKGARPAALSVESRPTRKGFSQVELAGRVPDMLNRRD